MSRRTLILVDFDNIVGAWGMGRVRSGELPWPVHSGWEQATEGQESSQCDPTTAKSVVVMGTNTAVARLCTFEYLHRLGQQLAMLVGVDGPTFCEIALTLPMPETADWALLRLLARAPRDHPVLMDEVRLLSNDSGLKGSVTQLLPDADKPSRMNSSSSLVGNWRWQLRRSCFQRGREADLETLPASGVAAPAPSLRDCAASIDGAPGRLSEVSVTTVSVEGVGRMNALAASKTIDCVDVPDALVTSPASGSSRTWNLQGDSIVGPGTIDATLPSQHAAPRGCLRTNLPSHALTSLQRVHANGATLDDQDALGRPMYSVGPVVHVNFLTGGRHGCGSRAKISASLPLATWWCLSRRQGGLRATSTYPRARDCITFLDENLQDNIIKVAAVPVKHRREIVLRSAYSEGGHLLGCTLPAGISGLFVGGVMLAVLSPKRLRPRTFVILEPIQDMTVPSWLGRYRADWNSLQRLPLLVVARWDLPTPPSDSAVPGVPSPEDPS